jgi:hypothetical protein
LDGESGLEYRLYGGWEIIVMGLAMLLLGLFLKWKLSSKRTGTNSGDRL